MYNQGSLKRYQTIVTIRITTTTTRMSENHHHENGNERDYEHKDETGNGNHEEPYLSMDDYKVLYDEIMDMYDKIS